MKKKLFLTLIILFLPLAARGYFSLSKEVVITNTVASVSPAPIDILEKIQKGILLLKSSPPLQYEMKKNKKGKLTDQLARKQIALAILNKNTGELFEKRVWIKEDEIQNYKKVGFISLESNETIDPMVTPLKIRVKWFNSFNSFYEIGNRPELVIVGNKYLLASDDLGNLPEKSKNKYTDIVYVPYSDALHSPELIAAGKKYIDANVNTAFTELTNKKVLSRSLTGHLVTDDIIKDFLKNIILVEHMDPDSFGMALDGGKELTDRVLIVIGANQNLAYRYTGSPAGASGLAQFIKSTYVSMVSKYPEANLIKDYKQGMASHVNALEAMVLFFDTHAKEIKNKIVRRDIIEQLGISEEMLAAAYNGGPSRVVTSINKYGIAWIDRQLDPVGPKTIFKKETIDYIKKFQSVKKLNLFSNISVE